LRAPKPDQQLVFQLDEAPLVAAGYHVTEVKEVTYNTMDCGGIADKWKETVIQLWNPDDEPEREYMTVRKFLAIYDRVAKHIPVSSDAELRFEYGDRRRPAARLSRRALRVARSADPRSPTRSRSDLQGKGSQKGQHSRRNQLLRLNLVNDAMDRALPGGDVQPTEPGRSAVVTALGITQIFAWGCSYHLPAVLSKPITAGTGWPLPWVVGGVSIGLFVAGLVSPIVGHTIQQYGGRAVLVLISVLLVIGLVGIGLAQNLIVYLAASIVVGLGMGSGSRRGVRDARADLSGQGKKSNHDAYTVRRVFEHDLLAAQRFAC
jgi:Family of unknown function (DUF6428)